jgi:hypothetical protein
MNAGPRADAEPRLVPKAFGEGESPCPPGVANAAPLARIQIAKNSQAFVQAGLDAEGGAFVRFAWSAAVRGKNEKWEAIEKQKETNCGVLGHSGGRGRLHCLVKDH